MESRKSAADNSCWAAVKRFTRAQDGWSVVETSVVVGLVAASVLVAVFSLGTATADVFDSATGSLFGATESEHPTEHLRSHAVAAQQPNHSHWPSFAALVLATGSLAVCLRQTVFSRSSKQDEGEEQAEEVEDWETFLTKRPDVVFQKRQELLKILSSDAGALFESRLEIQHLMSRKMKVVLPQTSREEIVEMMDQGRMRHLLVCDANEHLLGIISDRDVMQKEGKTAADIMTGDPMTVAPNAFVNPAVTLLIQRRISCLPVVDDGKLCGVITTTDLMMALQCTLTTLAKLATEIHGA